MRRLFLIQLIVVLVCGLILAGCAKPAPVPAPSPAPAPAPAPVLLPIKIGVVFPLTGPVGMVGARMVNAVKLAFEEVDYKVAGRKVELIVEDSGGTPQISIDKVKKLVEFDKVSVVIGPLLSPNRLAVAPYLSQARVPHVTTAPEKVKAFKYEWTISTGGSEAHSPSAMGAYAYDEMGLRTITLMTMDLADGRSFANYFKTAFEKRGGRVIQEQYPPQNSPDFASYLAALKDADAVAAWFHGADAIRFHNQFHEFGIRKRMPLIAMFHGAFFAPFILSVLTPEVGNATIGEYCATPYTSLIENDANKRFVEALRDKYGYTPDETDAGPYQGAIVVIEALKATGGDTTPEKLLQAMLAVRVESVAGPIRIDPETKCAIKDIYIVKVDKMGDEYIWVPVHNYKGVPPAGL